MINGKQPFMCWLAECEEFYACLNLIYSRYLLSLIPVKSQYHATCGPGKSGNMKDKLILLWHWTQLILTIAWKTGIPLVSVCNAISGVKLPYGRTWTDQNQQLLGIEIWILVDRSFHSFNPHILSSSAFHKIINSPFYCVPIICQILCTGLSFEDIFCDSKK